MRSNTWQKCNRRSDLFGRARRADSRNGEYNSHVANDIVLLTISGSFYYHPIQSRLTCTTGRHPESEYGSDAPIDAARQREQPTYRAGRPD
jgi:hypothetical protein